MKTLDASESAALQKKGVLCAMLFGSRASGKANRKSDTDVAILADHAISFMERYDLQVFFSRIFGTPVHKIDIADLRAANPLLAFLAMTEGTPLFGNEDTIDSLYRSAVKRHIDAKRLYLLDRDYVRTPL